MKAINLANFDLTRLGTRFREFATETQYRRWRDEHIQFLLLVGGAVSMVAFAVSGVAIRIWLPEVASVTTPVLAAIVALFVVALGLVWHPRPVRLRIPVVMVMVVVTSVTQFWLVMTIVEPVAGFASALAAACSLIIINSFFAPVMQLPPLPALVAVTPGIGLVIGFALDGYQTGLLDRYTVSYPVWYQLITINFVVVICILVDRNNRKTFVNETTIERQRESLSRSAKRVRRYVPPAVAEHIFDDNEAAIDIPQRRRVTVLFSDVVGFTGMADRLDAESLTQVLNEYMSAMASIVEAHGGTLNEFAGDGLMALFGAPDELSPEDQVLNAVRAAQKMQALLPELNNGWRKLGIGEPLRVRVGINTGVLSVGSFGSEGRMTYTAIGLQTNIASRIESKAAPGEILISDASYQLISEKVDCEPRGEVECKGVHFPVKVYAPNRGS